MTEIGKRLEVKEIIPIVKFLVTLVGISPRYQRPLLVFAKRVKALSELSGKVMAVAYLKQSSVDVFQHLAGTPRKGWSGKGVIVRQDRSNYLPSIIPATLRLAIVERDPKIIKVVLSILGLYRTFVIPGKVNLETITNSGPKDSISDHEIHSILRNLSPLSNLKIRWGRWIPVNLVTAGPNGSMSISQASKDAAAFITQPRLYLAFARIAGIWPTAWLTALGSLSWLYRIGQLPKILLSYVYSSIPITLEDQWRSGNRWFPYLGRLSIKSEPAGKERVFAITDWWTQSLMKPLHTSIFRALRTIPQDGTHDQLKPVKILLDLTRGAMPCYSFDLSAATDRFPVDIQEKVLSFYLGSTLARGWKQLLVGRRWLLPWSCFKDNLERNLWNYLALPNSSTSVLYGTGQPMGAYSSWAVFALSHHVVVQIAASRTGWKGWYPYYALLGDDIVIAGKEVADAYLALISQLGVEISMAKSLVCHEGGVVEFAKHCLTPAVDYSPVGGKVLLAAYRTGLYLPALATDLRDKSFEISAHRMLVNLPALLPFRRSKSAVAHHHRGSLSILGPSGAYPLPLIDWMSMTINPAMARNWLPPGLALSLAYVCSSIGQRKRDATVRETKTQISEFYSSWPGLDKGLPSLLSFLSPRFWVKALELREAEMGLEIHQPYSTVELRNHIRDGGHLTPELLCEALKGPLMDHYSSLFPPLPEESAWIHQSRQLAKLMNDLRSKAVRFYRTYDTYDPGFGTSLIVRTTVEDVSELMLAERFEDIPGCPWFITYLPAAEKYLNSQSKYREIFSSQPMRDLVQT